MVLLQPGVPGPLVLSGVGLQGGGEKGPAPAVHHGRQPRAVQAGAGAVRRHLPGCLLPPVCAGGVGGGRGAGV